jgi:integrase
MERRRGRGEGCVTKRHDGRYEARIDLGWQDGRRRYKSFFGPTRRGVANRLTKALRDLQRGAAVFGDERQTVGDYLARWLELVAPDLRPKTIKSYRQVVRVHLAPGLGHLRLTKLSPDDVDLFLHRKRQQGLSPRTCQYLRAVLRAALNRALKRDLIAKNAAERADAPTIRRAPVRTFTPDEARTFLTAIASHRHYALFALAVSCGLRQGELLGLRWQDVDVDRGVLKVVHQLERRGRGQGWQLVAPKSETSRRAIRVPDPIVAILRQQHVRQLEQRLAAGGDWKDSDFVFTARHGQPLDGCRLNAIVKDLQRQAGIDPPLHFHALRHSCATFLLVQRVPARVVMAILGHSDVRLTLNTYSHVLEDLHEDAAAKMTAVLFPFEQAKRQDG